MKVINVEITGLRPLLMHNIAGAELEKTARKSMKSYSREEDAEKAAYWKSDGKKKELCVPSRCLYGCIRIASGYFKDKGRSVKPIISGAVRIEPDEMGLGTNKYEIDTQSVVIQRARVLRSRPRIFPWKLKFRMIYNEEYIAKPDLLQQILQEAGVKVGLLDFRPAKGGNFGTFEVTKFEPA